SDPTAEASHTALFDFLTAPEDGRKRAILGIPDKVDPDSRRVVPKGIPDIETSEILNASQHRAVEAALQCDVYHLIWGPPGTGKTRVIPEIVSRIDGPVLLGAFTNTAVDKMLIALLERDPSIRFLRIGRASDSPELSALLKDPTAYFSEDLAARYGSI